MSLSKERVREALTPLFGGAHGGTASLLSAAACDGNASIKVLAPGRNPAAMDQLGLRAHQAVVAATQGSKVDSFTVEFVDDRGAVVHTWKAGTPHAAGHAPIPGLRPGPAKGALPGVKRIIAVGAGKGGVGKSTVALNLAVGLSRRGHAAGLLDGDIYGPSMPTMLGLDGLDAITRDRMLEPFYTHGVKAMTMGKLVAPDQPLIWRGPMAHGAFKQIAEQTNWGELDDLIIDLPPGTGDVALTMAQLLALSGAVVVCTPQRVAQDDAARAAKMFQQLGIEVLGVVENMSYFVGDDGKVYDLFGRGGAEAMAKRLGLPFLGAIPITMALREHCDRGDPTANFTGTDRAGVALRDSLEAVIDATLAQLSLAEVRSGARRPTLVIS